MQINSVTYLLTYLPIYNLCYLGHTKIQMIMMMMIMMMKHYANEASWE